MPDETVAKKVLMDIENRMDDDYPAGPEIQ